MKKFTIITAVLITANLIFAQIINIPDDYPTIQQGINAATDGDTVLVQPGTYVVNIVINGKSITLASLVLTTQDTSYISQTIIIGNVMINGLSQNPSVRFCGFTLTNSEGGGIYCNNSIFEIENTRVSGCQLGGILINSCPNSHLKNVTITNNYCQFTGGGIGFQDSNATLENVIISGNTAGDGGGVDCHESDLVCNNVTISDNIATDSINGYGWGGGISCYNSSILFQNGVIKNNSSVKDGGIYCFGSSPIFQNVLMSGNTCIENGSFYFGASVLHCSNNSHPILQNVTITGNEQYDYYYNWVHLIYCDDNTSSVSIANSIIYDNNIEYYSYIGNASAIFSNIEENNTYPGEGNINEDPLFLGFGDHPYQLSSGSPCIDTGTPDTTGLNLPWLDLMGNYRMWDGDFDGDTIVDMGAYEFGSIGVVVEAEKVQSSGFEVRCYPNPVSKLCTIEFDLVKPLIVSIQIFSSIGKKVINLESISCTGGKNQVTWNAANLMEGIYFCRIQIGNHMVTKKIIKVN